MKPEPQAPPVPWRITGRVIWRMTAMLGVSFVGAWTYWLRPKNRTSIASRAQWLSETCAHALRVLRIRVVETGQRPAGAMLTPNHLGYLDILVLSALSPTSFVAKAEVRRWPIFGWFAARAGTLFLRRERKSDLVRVGDQISPVLNAGTNLAVFLEGTSTDGSDVRRFRPGLLEPLVRIGGTAVPTTISYGVPDGHDASHEVAWWGEMPLLPHLTGIVNLPWIEARVDWGAPQQAGEDRKLLASSLEQVVRAQVQRRQCA